MNTIKRIKNDNYTTISNVFIKDEKLSLKAKGFLSLVMSLPSDWDFSINGICAVIKEGKTSIYNIISELKNLGYCEYTTIRNDKGLILGNDYIFYEEPKTNKKDECYPYSDNPDMDNQTQLNKDNNKVNIDNKEKESKEKKCYDENVDTLYGLYPSKCPKRNVSLGKCFKDKDRLRKLLKSHSFEMLKFTIEREIKEKYNKSYMSNFSTFLNNLPDYGYNADTPNNNDSKNTNVESEDNLVLNGITYK